MQFFITRLWTCEHRKRSPSSLEKDEDHRWSPWVADINHDTRAHSGPILIATHGIFKSYPQGVGKRKKLGLRAVTKAHMVCMDVLCRVVDGQGNGAGCLCRFVYY